ncbi:MAG TPA: caspase family protein [Pyrinomonadaceae bacterium]|nr:caspase family protein [Pyrinomonadaceae bacterium]
MSVKPTPPLVFIALLASVFLPQAALTQRRVPGVSQTLNVGAGRYYALVIGNDDYQSLPKLKTAAADARAVESVLRESYGFQTRLLLNATRAQIVAALPSYSNELTADDSLLIYYAGHGYNDRGTDKAYWLPVDATRDDTSNWITADGVTTRIRFISARHVLVVSDSCYSGILPSALAVSPSRTDERQRFVQQMAGGRSRTLMASGGDEPVADDGSVHSVFAAALLRGLRVTEGPQFTATELFVGYVLGPVASRTGQLPFYNPLRNSGHEGGDFVFTRIKPAPAPGSCDDLETKAERYKVFLDNYKGNPEQQKAAYEAGKDYVSRYDSCSSENDKNIVIYIRHWLDKYEEAVRVWQRGQSRHP